MNTESTIEDGLTACPICGTRMKEEAVYPHLDVHNDSASVTMSARWTSRPPFLISRLTSPSISSGHYLDTIEQSHRQSVTMERLPQLNYSLLKDTALRKKLSELGIPNGGSKDLLIRRHTEWVNLVNANCDSLKPKTKRELVHELELWDRTHGRQNASNSNAAGTSSSIMSKNFDGAAWASHHGSNFRSLIAQARRKGNAKAEPANSPHDSPSAVLDRSTDD